MFVCHIQVLDWLFSPAVTAVFLHTSPVSWVRANTVLSARNQTPMNLFLHHLGIYFHPFSVLCVMMFYILLDLCWKQHRSSAFGVIEGANLVTWITFHISAGLTDIF